jgi:hypothetical protein
MPASPLDSAIYRDLLGDAEVGRLFTDTAEVRAMLLVEGALAEVQGEMGLIPETAAKAIHRAALELQIDPGALAAETGRNAVPVPALVAAFRAEMKAPEHAQYVHWGATSQDIMDTALMLRLRRVLEIAEARMDAVLGPRRAGRGPCRPAHGRPHLRAGGHAHELRRRGGGLGRAASGPAGRSCRAPAAPSGREPRRRGGHARRDGPAAARRCARVSPTVWALAIRAEAGTPSATGSRRWRGGFRGSRGRLPRWART